MPRTRLQLRRLCPTWGAPLLVVACTIALTGCQTVPPAPAYTLRSPEPTVLAHSALVARDRERLAGASELLARNDLASGNRVSLLVQRAGARITIGESAAAVADFQEAIRLVPDSASLRVGLARVLWMLDHETEAREQVAAARALAPSDPDVLMTDGLLEFAAGHWDNAAMHFAAARTQQPRNAQLALLTAAARLRIPETPRTRIDDPLEQVIRTGLWPAPVAEAMLGRRTAADLEVVAEHPDPIIRQRWRTEVAFYLGEHAAGSGDRVEAMRRYREAIAYGAAQQLEFTLARARLRAAGVMQPEAGVSISEPPREKSPSISTETDTSEMTDESRTTFEIHRLVRSGAIDRAILRLRASGEGELTDEQLQMLASLLLQSGRAADAIATWRSSLNGDAGDWQPLAAIGWTELQLAIEHGVNPQAGFMNRAMVAAFNPASFLAQKAGAKHLAAARDAFQQARTLRPDDPALARVTAHVLEFSRNPAAALAIWEELRAQTPDDPEITVGLARSIVALNRPAEAQPLIDAVLADAPNHAAARTVLAEITRQAGNRAESRRQEEWAQFAHMLPPGSRLAFTPENAEAVKKTVTQFVVFGPYVGRVVPRERPGLVERWLGDPSENATGLLAAAWWNTSADDGESVKLARELHRRGATGLLHAALEDGQNPLAVGGAARALAETGDRSIVRRLLDLLPQDQQREQVADIAGSLGILVDVRAIVPLVMTLEPGFESSPGLTYSQSEGVLGHRAARARAALALAAFDSEYVRNALLAGATNPEIAIHCQAALFAQTKEPGHLSAIESALRYTEFIESRRTFEMLERTGDPAALALVENWRKRLRQDLD